jgi:hypothetical protein
MVVAIGVAGIWLIGCGGKQQHVASAASVATTSTSPSTTTQPPSTSKRAAPNRAKRKAPLPRRAPPAGALGGDTATAEVVTSDGSVVVLDNGAVYSMSSGDDASSWEGDDVKIAADESALTDLSNGEKFDVSHVGDTADSNAYAGTGDHSQDTNTSDGAIIVLDDGSVWSVEPGDQSTASTWTDAAAITVNEASGTSYELVNTDEHETVTANYIGDK